MPIYEYACSACGHEFEEWQKMSDPPVRTCPKCKKKKVERLISQTAFQLKGGGWYADLYSSSKPGKTGSSDSSEGAGDKGSGDKAAAGEGSKDSGSKDATSAKSDSKASTKSDSKSGKSAESSSKKESKTASKKSETRAA